MCVCVSLKAKLSVSTAMIENYNLFQKAKIELLTTFLFIIKSLFLYAL